PARPESSRTRSAPTPDHQPPPPGSPHSSAPPSPSAQNLHRQTAPPKPPTTPLRQERAADRPFRKRKLGAAHPALLTPSRRLTAPLGSCLLQERVADRPTVPLRPRLRYGWVPHWPTTAAWERL